MARSRQIKPDFFLNEGIAELEPIARLLFVGLWLLADRDGRLEDRPQRIKAQLFPYEEIDAEALLGSLDRRFIARYEVEGERYIEVLKFKKHQHIHPDEKKSVIPAFPGFPGDSPGLPGIMPCSSSPSSVPSSSSSPSTSTTATPQRAAVDRLIDSIKTNVPKDYDNWRFPRGFNAKYAGAYLINVPADECVKLLKTPRLGTQIREALEWRIKTKDEEMQKDRRRRI